MGQLYWSGLLTTMFLASLILVGRKNAWGWAAGILDELLWIAYAITTRQWPFLVSAGVYMVICFHNLRTWRRPTESDARPFRAAAGSAIG
jgi:hypothetical protein